MTHPADLLIVKNPNKRFLLHIIARNIDVNVSLHREQQNKFRKKFTHVENPPWDLLWSTFMPSWLS